MRIKRREKLLQTLEEMEDMKPFSSTNPANTGKDRSGYITLSAVTFIELLCPFSVLSSDHQLLILLGVDRPMRQIWSLYVQWRLDRPQCQWTLPRHWTRRLDYTNFSDKYQVVTLHSPLMFKTDLPELLRADLAVPVPVKEGEGLLQALHLLDADVTVRAGLVLLHDVTITGVTNPGRLCHVSRGAKMREKSNFNFCHRAFEMRTLWVA